MTCTAQLDLSFAGRQDDRTHVKSTARYCRLAKDPVLIEVPSHDLLGSVCA